MPLDPEELPNVVRGVAYPAEQIELSGSEIPSGDPSIQPDTRPVLHLSLPAPAKVIDLQNFLNRASALVTAGTSKNLNDLCLESFVVTPIPRESPLFLPTGSQVLLHVLPIFLESSHGKYVNKFLSS